MPLRIRLWLSLAPLLLVLALLGGALLAGLGVVGGRIDGILRENYRSVEAMNGVDDAAGRIDAALLSELAGRPGGAAEYADQRAALRRHLDTERGNVTEPGEAELVAELAGLVDRADGLGERFFAPGRTAAERAADYGPLLDTVRGVRRVSDQIRRVNQAAMEGASRDAKATAATVRVWAAAGMLLALAATGVLGWRTGRAVLRPVEDLTRSARAVGDGRFDLPVRASTRDEVGELVAAFNRMTVQLKDLRQTEAARLVRAQQASQATLDAFPDPVLVIDPAGRVDMANPAARQVLGVVPGGDPAGPAWEPPDTLREPLSAALLSQQAFRSESFDRAVTYRVGGEERTYIPRVLPVRDPYGNTLGAAVVLADVTRFRLLDEFKSDLVATASHELKTPLAGLRLAVHLLLEEAVGPLAPKQLELLIDARENTERLVRIVDHLLALARLEGGREPLAVRPSSAGDLLKAAVERVQPLLNDRRVTVEVDPDTPPVSADPDRLGHALDNLLVNAAVYTPPDGTVALSARPLGAGEVELSVRDTGVGIPAEYLPRVFDKFFRVPGQTRGQGTGLGLAIVREVLTAHGGRAACESEPGRGTVFRLALPAARAVQSTE